MPGTNFKDPKQLSEDFHLDEFLQSRTAHRLGIDNSIRDRWHLRNIQRLTDHFLQPVRDYYG
jgi:hypothetical protein